MALLRCLSGIDGENAIYDSQSALNHDSIHRSDQRTLICSRANTASECQAVNQLDLYDYTYQTLQGKHTTPVQNNVKHVKPATTILHSTCSHILLTTRTVQLGADHIYIYIYIYIYIVLAFVDAIWNMVRQLLDMLGTRWDC